jgi:hypothetical protein
MYSHESYHQRIEAVVHQRKQNGPGGENININEGNGGKNFKIVTTIYHTINQCQG